MILKNVENQIIQEVKDHIEDHPFFSFEDFKFYKYENGIFKFLATETILNEKSSIQYNPYTGGIEVTLENDPLMPVGLGVLEINTNPFTLN